VSGAGHATVLRVVLRCALGRASCCAGWSRDATAGRNTWGNPLIDRKAPTGRDLIAALARAHDWLTDVSRNIGTVALGVIVYAYCYEVAARYFFGAPTTWANELVSYALCVSVFMLLPYLTRTGGHVAVTIVIDSMPPRIASAMKWLINLTGFVVLALTTWISLDENVRQYVQDVYLMKVHPIPQLWPSAFMTYGFAMSAIHFLRHLGVRHETVEADGTGRI
jgi:C4-dicarboxylate transporter, DctQ subunit